KVGGHVAFKRTVSLLTVPGMLVCHGSHLLFASRSASAHGVTVDGTVTDKAVVVGHIE
ncbi:hypothetical protein EVA_10514, partial [gut metagenome]